MVRRIDATYLIADCFTISFERPPDSRNAFTSYSIGMIPFKRSSWSSSLRPVSQFRMYAVAAARNGRPVQMVDLMVLSKPASTTLKMKVNIDGERGKEQATYNRFDSSGALDSLAATNLVPIQTAEAPYTRDAASPRPSQIPPAATSCTGCPVKGDLYFATISAQAGTKILPIAN